MLLLATSGMFAQKKMFSDRPDFTNSPSVLAVGFVQFESGIYFANEKFSDTDPAVEIQRIGILGTLVRIGISDMFELRFGGEYLMRNVKTGEAENNAKGLNSLMVGTKFQFLSVEKSFADAALILEVGLPFGSADFKPEKAEPKIYLAFARDLFEDVTLSCNAGTQYQSDNGKYLSFGSINTGVQLSERVGIFAEYYSLFSKETSPASFVDIGINYLQGKNLLVDLYFGKEVTPKTNAWFMGAGFSLRLPD